MIGLRFRGLFGLDRGWRFAYRGGLAYFDWDWLRGFDREDWIVRCIQSTLYINED